MVRLTGIVGLAVANHLPVGYLVDLNELKIYLNFVGSQYINYGSAHTRSLPDQIEDIVGAFRPKMVFAQSSLYKNTSLIWFQAISRPLASSDSTAVIPIHPRPRR